MKMYLYYSIFSAKLGLEPLLFESIAEFIKYVKLKNTSLYIYYNLENKSEIEVIRSFHGKLTKIEITKI